MKKVLVLIAVLSIAVAGVVFADVTDSHHDMTLKGASGTTQVCVFCHHPHRGNAGGADATLLWNWNNALTTFTTYDSATMNATYADLDGTGDNMYSFACMGCHDGATAADTLYVQPGDATTTINGIEGALSGSAANLGTTLADDHPVGFDYTTSETDTGIKASSGDEVVGDVTSISYPLYTSTMQCATCHMVHEAGTETIAGIQFMRMASTNTLTGSAICMDCHTNK